MAPRKTKTKPVSASIGSSFGVATSPHAGSGIPLTGANARSAVTRHVLGEIRKGTWRVGSKIATEDEMAQQLHVSKSMVNQALKQIEKDGVLVRYRRRGTFVAKLPDAQMDLTMARLRVPSDRVHLLTPIDAKPLSMHWNSAALYQLETVLNAAGLQVVHSHLPNCPTPAVLRQCLNQLAQEESRGMVILGSLVSVTQDQPVAKALIPLVMELMNYPSTVVWLNRSGIPLNAWPFDALSFSTLNQGVMVGQHIMKHAVKRVICANLARISWAELRMMGVQVGLDRSAGDIKVDTVELVHDSLADQCWEKVIKDIARQKDRPTVVTPNDLYAAGLIDAARRHGLSCPKDYCVISFDNYDPCRHYNITTVAPTVNHLGEAIGMLISDQVRHPANSAVHLTLNSTLMERLTFSYPPAH